MKILKLNGKQRRIGKLTAGFFVIFEKKVNWGFDSWILVNFSIDIS